MNLIHIKGMEQSHTEAVALRDHCLQQLQTRDDLWAAERTRMRDELCYARWKVRTTAEALGIKVPPEPNFRPQPEVPRSTWLGLGSFFTRLASLKG